MLSPWKVSWLGGAAIGILVIAYTVHGVLPANAPPPGGIASMLIAASVAALVLTAVVATSVRIGLYFAGCKLLHARGACVILGILVAVLGILGIIPIPSHAVVVPMDGTTPTPIEIPATLWAAIVGIAAIPAGVAYGVARFLRVPASAA